MWNKCAILLLGSILLRLQTGSYNSQRDVMLVGSVSDAEAVLMQYTGQQPGIEGMATDGMLSDSGDSVAFASSAGR